MSPQIPSIDQSAEALLDKANRCRRLARHSTDKRAIEALTTMAVECEAKAAELVIVVRRAAT